MSNGQGFSFYCSQSPRAGDLCGVGYWGQSKCDGHADNEGAMIHQLKPGIGRVYGVGGAPITVIGTVEITRWYEYTSWKERSRYCY